jgi:peroxiredoxin
MRSFVFALILTLPLIGANQTGRRAPSFALPDSQQKYHDILDYRGKVLVLEFMTTACPHCQETAKILEQVKAKYRDKITILHVVNPPDNLQSVANFVGKTKSTSPFLFDSGQVTASYVMATAQNPSVDVPQLFIIDPQGVIRANYEGEAAALLKVDALGATIDKAMTGK